MSVKMSIPLFEFTDLIAELIIFLNCSTFSVKLIDADMSDSGAEPNMIPAVSTSASPRCPCVTITIPTIKNPDLKNMILLTVKSVFPVFVITGTELAMIDFGYC
jgi:hypothetical protein